MKAKAWPSTYQGEQRPIPVPSSHPHDILVELRLLTRKRHEFFEKIIDGHSHFSVVRGNVGKASTPELIIVEAGYDHHPAFSFIKSITQHPDGPDIFLTSEVSDARLAEQAFEIGVKEFFPSPLDSKAVSTALDRYALRRGKKAKKRRHRARGVISVLGGGGGVGTTTAVVNLGLGLQQMKEAPSVVLLELNQQAGDLEIFLNASLSHSLRELGDATSKIDESVMKPFLGEHTSGLSFLSSGNTDFQIKKLASEWIEPIISYLRSRFDFVLIDCGHLLDASSTAALGHSSHIIIVSTLTLPVIRRTKVVLEFLKRGGIPAEKIHWMLNRYVKAESRLLQEAEEMCGHHNSWVIPNDFPRANQSVNNGCPLLVDAPKSAIARGFLSVASYLLENHDVPKLENSKVQQWVSRIWSPS